MAIMIMYKDGVPFFIKDRKNTDKMLKKGKFVIDYIFGEATTIIKLDQNIIQDKQLAGPITKLLPEMYSGVPSTCDGAEIVGLLLRPMKLKEA